MWAPGVGTHLFGSYVPVDDNQFLIRRTNDVVRLDAAVNDRFRVGEGKDRQLRNGQVSTDPE